MDRQPNRPLTRISPSYTVLLVGRDIQVRTSLQFHGLGITLNLQGGTAFQEHDPFVVVLVMPEPFG